MKCDVDKEWYLYGQNAFFSCRTCEMWKSLSWKITGSESGSNHHPALVWTHMIEGTDEWRKLPQGDKILKKPYGHMGLSSVLYSSLDGRGVWGRMDACMWMTGSLCWSPETITILFVNRLYSNTKLKALKKLRVFFLKLQFCSFQCTHC